MIRLTVPQAAITERIRQSVEQSIQIVERRVNELGTVEPLIQRQGLDRILVQVPGLQDPTAPEGTARQDRQDGIPDGRSHGAARSGDRRSRAARIRNCCRAPNRQASLRSIKKQVLVSGGDLTDAQPGFDQRSGQPIVSFKFNTSGSRKFAQATTEHVKEPFAIVLDSKVISAPVIQEPITGGSGPDFRQFHRPAGQ